MTASAIEVAELEGFNPFDQAYIHDPLGQITRMHTVAPVFYYRPLDVWFITKYSDVKRALKDAETFSNKVFGFLPPPADLGPKVKVFTDHELLVGMDAPEHSTLRQPLASVFTHRLISDMEETVRETANKLIDSFIDDREGELMTQYSYPLTLATIVQVFGMPAEDSALFRGWTDDFMSMLTFKRSADAKVDEQLPPEKVREHWTNILGAKKYFEEYVARLRTNPEQNVFSNVLALKKPDGGNVISNESAVANFPNLIAAGHDTTANLIGQAFRLLSDNPDQLKLLQDDLSLVPQAIEETLRMRPSSPGALRTTKSAVVVRGIEIPAGASVFVMLNAAGLDAEQFENPGKFDLRRTNSAQHLAFGIGRHSCIGSQLARLQARVAINELLQRIPSARLSRSKSVTYTPSLGQRLTTSLPIEW
ncbi:cytochrome P450 [Sphingobium sp. JS3065]|jgi:cytochrome P450|uniref:cytochrome P450 n=1 Tax=Sphingobium sp. JS3065 TaxID=2970925 RepID=UPI0022651C8F|nr:cytochrome P450 [Sphingobium sp. JS3065]UZW57452.1 cytochrome P450 [Sphingobium sp. JS3065]